MLMESLQEVLDLHRDGGPSQGYGNDGYGYLEHACAECGTFGEYGVEWPCETYRLVQQVRDKTYRLVQQMMEKVDNLDPHDVVTSQSYSGDAEAYCSCGWEVRRGPARGVAEAVRRHRARPDT